MAKAMLIMDMPSSCNVCRYCRTCLRRSGSNSECLLLPRQIEKKELYKRPTWCPLRECPQQKDENNAYDDCEYYRMQGYNACIDEILGGAENG